MALQEPTELPKDWVIAPIEELFSRQSDGKLIHQGWSPQCHREAAPDGEWGVLKTTAIQDGYFLEHENKHLPSDKPPRERLEVKPQDFLLTCAGPRNRCGVSTLVRTTREKLLISGKMYRFRVYENLIAPSYLEAWLRTFTATQFIDSIKTGISESGLNITHARFKPMPVIVAPFAEQKRIVEKLDSLLAQVETIQQRLNNLPNIIKRFRQSVLAAAVSGKLTEQWRGDNKCDDWKEVILSNITRSISDGDHQAPPKAESGIPFLVISNVKTGNVNFENVTRWVPASYYDSLKDIRVPGIDDILYTVTGSFGIPVQVKTNEKFCFQRHIAIIKPNIDFASSRFLYHLLNSDFALRQAEATATGTAQKTVALSSLRGFQFSIPSLKEQTEIVRLVEQHFALADTLEKNLKNAKQRVDNLTQSILAKAFKGELVPQDPNDEPAEQLLARIKTARAEAELLEKAAKKVTSKTKRQKGVVS
jgi:type I restriction enzyme S subunit